MKLRPLILLAALWLAGTMAVAAPTAVSEAARDSLEKIRVLAEETEKANQTVIRGKDGWLFFAPELRTLSVGRFWGGEAAKVSRASSPDARDPLPAILDFRAQLDRAGIELIFVPVPAKATIYPEMLSDGLVPSGRNSPPRYDVYHQEFYKLLSSKGVKVIDLVPEFLKHRDDGGGYLFCGQDTHWSGRACALTAKLVAAEIRNRPWLTKVSRRKFEKEELRRAVTGDLWTALGDEKLPKETLPLTVVKERTTRGLSPVDSWRESPVLLVGDSHNLVFHGGDDMHAQGAGLADQLAAELGFPVDLVAVRGSGATPSRLSLFRRKDNMAGKKVVIWCLSVREFTEGQGWRKVPILP